MGPLDQFRSELNRIDEQLVDLLGRRYAVCRQVALVKRSQGIPMMQPARVAEVKERSAALAARHGVDSNFMRELFGMIIDEACRLEDEIIAPTEDRREVTGSMTTAVQFRRVTIVGGNGMVGQLLGTALAASDGPHITIIDRRESAAALAGATVVVGDIREPSAAVREALAASDLVVLATPEDVAVDALPLLSSLLPASARLIDTLSVKSRFASQLARHPPACDVIGINPMFAPDLGWTGRSVIVVPYAAGTDTARLLRLIAQWGATAVSMSAEQHDRACAALQVATHAAVLGFALALEGCGYDPRVLEPVMPPPHRTLLALAARMLAAHPAVYHDIQAANPYAAEMRTRLRDAHGSLEASITAGPEDFARQLSGLRAMVSPGSVDYTALCARLFAVK